MYKIYEVQSGDTLVSLAARLGVTPEVLATLNGLNVGSAIQPNSYIVVPGGNSFFDKYIVENGDTIYKIALDYNVDPIQLLRLNGLDDEEYIYPGQEILVPRSNTGFYVTDQEDTINVLTQRLRVPIETIARQNDTIYLMPDQLIVYKK